MKDTTELKEILNSLLQIGSSIAIMSHVEPDGDGFAASLALHYYLLSRGISSQIVVDNDDLERFRFLMEGEPLVQYRQGLSYDLLIVLDCNSYSRLNDRAGLVGACGYTLLIDHHVPENGVIKADFSFVDTSAASVGAILFRALQAEITALPPAELVRIANCLYISIINDTNNFTNANTNAEVLCIAAELSASGINPSLLYKACFLNHLPLEMRYVGEVLSTIELHSNKQILYMYSTLEMQQRNDLKADSVMNLTRYVQGVKGILIIAYLREEERNLYKLSLRSPVIDVNAIAASYGGGGHRSASGANVRGELSQIKAGLLGKLNQALGQYTGNAAS